MGLVIRGRSKGWSIKSTRFRRLDVVRCEMITNSKRTPTIGDYLLPSALEHLPDVEEALAHLWDQDPIKLGNLNADICQSQNPRSQQVAHLLMEFGLVHLLHHFQQRWRFRHMKTWLQVQQGRLLRARCDYILGTDWRQFNIVGIRNMQNYQSDHFALRERILQRP